MSSSHLKWKRGRDTPYTKILTNRNLQGGDMVGTRQQFAALEPRNQVRQKEGQGRDGAGTDTKRTFRAG